MQMSSRCVRNKSDAAAPDRGSAKWASFDTSMTASFAREDHPEILAASKV